METFNQTTHISRKTAERTVGAELMDIYEKVAAGERLSFDDGMRLYETPNLSAVGWLANIVRERWHGDKAFYVRNQHINYTNICNKFCKFCSFYAKKGGPKAYEMDMAEVRRKLEMHLDVPITEIHMVGGINPRLPYQYYIDLLQLVKSIRPHVHIKAFTAVELAEIQRQAKSHSTKFYTNLWRQGWIRCPAAASKFCLTVCIKNSSIEN